jgi:signal transduction histidine kinase/ActR/RegA family two-component response regulator
LEAKLRSQSAHELELIAHLAHTLASSAGVDGVLRAAAELFFVRLPAERLTVYLVDSDPSRFLVREVSLAGQTRAVKLRAALSGTPAAELRDRIAKVLDSGSDVSRDAELVRCPLSIEGDVLGVLEIAGPKVPVGPDEQRLISIAAAHLIASIQRERLIDQLDRKQRDLADAKRHLARSGWLESLGELLAGTAHEFNNLISAILGRAQILRRVVESPELLRSIEVIEKAAIDGSGLVKRIRDRMQQDSATRARPVELSTLVRDTVERVVTRIESRLSGEAIDVEIELDSTPAVLGNATELRQVLTNLTYNAVDAMPEGGRLIVRTGTDSAKGEAWFEVEDSGTGMDEETKESMFQPFFTTKGSRGTGLGLSVSLEIVTRHGGRFDVDSEPGRGTRVRATLPTHRGVDLRLTPRHEMEAVRLQPTTAQRHDVARPRILVIDDDRAVRDVLTEMLHTAEYQVVAAASGEEGLALFRGSRFDLVFTDLGMPSMNGWEVAAEIKAQSPRTPVGVITGWDASVDRERLRDLGVDLIIAKPFRFQEVMDVVLAAIGPAERTPDG